MHAREHKIYPGLILFLFFSSLFPSLEIIVFYLCFPHCCLPVEDESYDCSHDNADTQNNHDPILQTQPWGQTSTLLHIEKKTQ